MSHFLHHHGVPYSRPGTPSVHGPACIGFVGLGAIGYCMAKNLAVYRTTHIPGSSPVIVWNRTASKGEALAKEVANNSIKPAQTLEEVVAECDIIITNLANDAVVKSIYELFAKALSVCLVFCSLLISECTLLQQNPPQKPKTFVETSTVSPVSSSAVQQRP
jgi:3-hydroxyisobutyrate dehydrogenase-like beta-hydroxyacid dehydrogenase